MGTNTIRRKEVYERFIARKRPDESVSDLLDRHTDWNDQFERGFGALVDVDFDAALDELDERLDDERRAA